MIRAHHLLADLARYAAQEELALRASVSPASVAILTRVADRNVSQIPTVLRLEPASARTVATHAKAPVALGLNVKQSTTFLFVRVHPEPEEMPLRDAMSSNHVSILNVIPPVGTIIIIIRLVHIQSI